MGAIRSNVMLKPGFPEEGGGPGSDGCESCGAPDAVTFTLSGTSEQKRMCVPCYDSGQPFSDAATWSPEP